MNSKNFIVIAISLFFLLNLALVGFKLNNKTEIKLESHHEEIPLLAGETPARYLWNITWSNPWHDWCNDIIISESGNIYAVGVSEAVGPGNRILLLKYNKTKGLECETIISSFYRGSGFGIALDSQENIYIVGVYLNEGSPGLFKYNIVLMKCNKFGDLLWNKTWGGVDNDFAYDLALDSSNNIYVVGYKNS